MAVGTGAHGALPAALASRKMSLRGIRTSPGEVQDGEGLHDDSENRISDTPSLATKRREKSDDVNYESPRQLAGSDQLKSLH